MAGSDPGTPHARAAAAAARAAVWPRVRWMGSKHRLLPHLAQVFADVAPQGGTALDAFSGSGVVSYLLKHQGFAVHANDYLGFPGVVATAGVVNHDVRLTPEQVELLCSPAADDRDFCRRTFTGVYFTPDDLAFLDSAWSHVATMDGHARAVAIAALCLAAARKQPRGVFTISGDLSRYDDGRRDLRLSIREHLLERVEDYHRAIGPGPDARVTTCEATQLPAERYDLVYLDPPYAPPTDDNDYTKRFHFLEGLSRYWEGDEVMPSTLTRKLPKRVTGFSSRRTIEQALGTVLDAFRDSPLVLSYSSHAEPDRETLVGMLREVKGSVEVRTVPHTYSYGTHRTAVRRRVEEMLLVAV